jgi:pre-mRNA cleavage complex 2 protein Pcf11
MSARSPRGSLSGASSDEIAEDFGDMLKDLVINDRDMISGLTLIAKESTEHAQAISRVLENHIKTVRPLDHVITGAFHIILSGIYLLISATGTSP